MPPKTHKKSKPFWLVRLTPRLLEASRDVTWGDVQACIVALNAASSDVFAGLHRSEGGFMCVRGTNFESEDRVDSGLPHQNPPSDVNKVVHKEIRFGSNQADWPSWNSSFLGNNLLTDDWVVLHRGDETSLDFQGQHCVPWTREECKAHARVVAQTLGLEPLSMASRKPRRAHP